MAYHKTGMILEIIPCEVSPYDLTDANDPAISASMMDPFFWHGSKQFCSDFITLLLTVISALMDPES
jgi:hypothetical protein